MNTFKIWNTPVLDYEKKKFRRFVMLTCGLNFFVFIFFGVSYTLEMHYLKTSWFGIALSIFLLLECGVLAFFLTLASRFVRYYLFSLIFIFHMLGLSFLSFALVTCFAFLPFFLSVGILIFTGIFFIYYNLKTYISVDRKKIETFLKRKSVLDTDNMIYYVGRQRGLTYPPEKKKRKKKPSYLKMKFLDITSSIGVFIGVSTPILLGLSYKLEDWGMGDLRTIIGAVMSYPFGLGAMCYFKEFLYDLKVISNLEKKIGKPVMAFYAEE